MLFLVLALKNLQLVTFCTANNVEALPRLSSFLEIGTLKKREDGETWDSEKAQ